MRGDQTNKQLAELSMLYQTRHCYPPPSRTVKVLSFSLILWVSIFKDACFLYSLHILIMQSCEQLARKRSLPI